MLDLQLQLLNFFFFANSVIEFFFFSFVNFFDPFTFKGFFITNFKLFYQFSQNSSIFFAFKFLGAIGFLILVRGGTPRYRYDYLTKLGWLKFIGLVLTIFFFSISSFFVF